MNLCRLLNQTLKKRLKGCFREDKLEKAVTNAPAEEKNLGTTEILKQEIIKYLSEKHPGEGKEKQVLAFVERRN